MKLHLNPATATPATPGVQSVAKPPEPAADTGDAILISSASTALNQLSANRSATIDRITASVQGGSYQISSEATSNAIVEEAVSGRN